MTTLCATCRQRPATRMAEPAEPASEDRALRLLGLAFPGATLVLARRHPVCRTCIRQAGRYRVALELSPLPRAKDFDGHLNQRQRPAVRSVRLPDLDANTVLGAIRQGAHDAVAEHLTARPLDTQRWGEFKAGVTSRVIAEVFTDDETPERTAEVRGVELYIEEAARVTFASRKGACPSCKGRIRLRDKLVGFQRVDSPDELMWVCRHCANRLVRPS